MVWSTAHVTPPSISKNENQDEEIITCKQSCFCTLHESVWGSGIIAPRLPN